MRKLRYRKVRSLPQPIVLEQARQELNLAPKCTFDPTLPHLEPGCGSMDILVVQLQITMNLVAYTIHTYYLTILEMRSPKWMSRG